MNRGIPPTVTFTLKPTVATAPSGSESEMQIMKAHNQWATRPAEERFWDLQELHNHCKTVHGNAAEATAVLGDLRVEADNSDLKLVGKQGVPATISHFAFGQLAARVKAPAGYLRGLPPTLAAQNLNHGLKELGAASDTKSRLLLHRNGNLVLRAATSEKYARVWNDELVERVIDVLPDGWRAPPARPVGIAGERTRTATDADVVRLSQHLGLSVKVGDTIAPAGLYASDKDMFLFLINENDPVSDGTNHPLFRGMMLWNSEVGDMSLGGMAFLLKGVCGNHIIHDATNVFEFNFRHVGRVQSRTNSALEVEIKKYAESSATEQTTKIEAAKRMVLGATKDEVIDAVLGFARTKKLAGLNEPVLSAAYDRAEEHSSWYGVGPKTVYGMVNGLTEVSQKITSHTDDRMAIDKAAGRVMELAF